MLHLERMNITGIGMLPMGSIGGLFITEEFCWRAFELCDWIYGGGLQNSAGRLFSFSQVNNLIMCDRMRGQTPSFQKLWSAVCFEDD